MLTSQHQQSPSAASSELLCLQSRSLQCPHVMTLGTPVPGWWLGPDLTPIAVRPWSRHLPSTGLSSYEMSQWTTEYVSQIVGW